MAWEAHTAWSDIEAGTHLRLVESPTVRELPPPPFEVGTRIGVETANNTRFATTIIDPEAEGELRLELDDRSIWRLTRATGDDRIENIDVGALRFQDWIVREIV